MYKTKTTKDFCHKIQQRLIQIIYSLREALHYLEQPLLNHVTKFDVRLTRQLTLPCSQFQLTQIQYINSFVVFVLYILLLHYLSKSERYIDGGKRNVATQN